jgi:hypothetical protein
MIQYHLLFSYAHFSLAEVFRTIADLSCCVLKVTQTALNSSQFCRKVAHKFLESYFYVLAYMMLPCCCALNSTLWYRKRKMYRVSSRWLQNIIVIEWLTVGESYERYPS